ncbi:MAG: ammonium transporter [Pirellulales bacterium]
MGRRWDRSTCVLVLTVALLSQLAGLLVGSAEAQVPADAGSQPAIETVSPGPVPVPAGETASVPGIDTGDNAWVLVSAALVLFMTAPGLAMFYSGLVRRKNVLGVMMQCLFLMALMSVVWALWGYTLAFGGDGATHRFIGTDEFLFLKGVTVSDGVAPLHDGYRIPRLTFMAFQGMFFIITPALICGAFAERMKFSTMVVFMVCWGTLVYCPICHWVWDGGILARGATGAWSGGALDFAGGTVVHISSGISALICALLIGRRLGFGLEDMRPHNLTYTALGAAMLWVGWFGFNGGSALRADGIAASALVVTHLAAAAGALTWAAAERFQRGKPSVLGTASGAVAGLVCITPASGYVQPMPALAMGAAAGLVCYFACSRFKTSLGYDDSLDAFGVHGVGGTLGAILTGIFASPGLSPLATGLVYDFESGVELVRGQAVAVLVTVAYSAAVTFVLLKLLDLTMGLRVSQEHEIRGLDLAEHGEEGYIF